MDSPISTSSSYLPYAAAAAAGATITLLLYYSAFHRRLHRSSTSPPLPPGPLGLPLFGSLPFLDPELHSFFARLVSDYGPIYSLSLGSKLAVVISSPVLAAEVLRRSDRTFDNHDVPAAARVIAYGGADIVWSPYGPTWRMLRRVCVREMLGPASLDTVYHLRRRELRAAIRHLHVTAATGEAVDLGAQMFLAVLNVITGMLWGGTVRGEDERSAVGKEFRELVGEITELLGKPNVSDFFPAIARFDVQGIEKKMRVLLERFDGIFAKIIDRKKTAAAADAGGDEGGKDFLEYMLKLEEEGKESNTPFTITHVKALLMDMVVGGTDTSSSTFEFAMAEMMNRPETMKRAQEELDHVVGQDNVVEESHLSKLPYLAMIIKETLRLHPALPLLVPHCPSSPAAVGGCLVPAGSRVFVNVWAIHREPTLWKDPLEFRPERFTEAAGKWDFSGRGELSYFPFGAGRRICAGIAMAERMVSYSLASLVHSFDWRLPEGTKLDLSEKFGIVLKKKKPLVVIPIPRLSNTELYT